MEGGPRLFDRAMPNESAYQELACLGVLLLLGRLGIIDGLQVLPKFLDHGLVDSMSPAEPTDQMVGSSDVAQRMEGASKLFGGHPDRLARHTLREVRIQRLLPAEISEVVERSERRVTQRCRAPG